MKMHFLAVVDRGHVRVFQETQVEGIARNGLQLVEAFDLIAAHEKMSDKVTDNAGQFYHSGPGKPGGSTGEQMGLKTEEQRRLASMAAEWLSQFFRERKSATWDLAVPETLVRQVMERIEVGARTRLRRTIAKDLTKQPVETLRNHFAVS